MKLAIVVVVLAIIGFAAWSVHAQSVEQDRTRYQEDYSRKAVDYTPPAPTPPGQEPKDSEYE